MVTRDRASAISTVAVIGAGLAGAACARVLATRGFQVSLFERQQQAASAASGNPIGILHPLVSADHNLASQWVEVGVATTLRWLGELKDWTATAALRPRGGELVNIIASGAAEKLVIARPQSGRGNPRSHRSEIGEQCPVLQLTPDCSALIHWTHQGAWIRPAKFVRACLAHAQDNGARLVFGKAVCAIHERPKASGVELAFSNGDSEFFDAVVLANGQGVNDLLPGHALRLNAIRGTVTAYQISEQHSLPCIICANGYATPVIDGEMVVGASYERIDAHGNIQTDPVRNLERLATISPLLADHCSRATALDRTSVRIATHDRMPHIGRVLNDQAPLTPNMSQLHHLPRSDRVWVLAGLGSRGLSFAPLGAEVIADQLAGRTPALNQRLLERVDPVRFALRQHQRRAVVPRSC